MSLLTPLAFRERFNMDEKRAIYTAAQSSVDVRIWLDDLAVAQEVDTTFAATVEGVQALEAAGLIGAGRAAEILGNAAANLGRARVLAPFADAYPGDYAIVAETASCVSLEGIGDFDPSYIERI